jgi:hypothetical protein
MHEAIPPLPQYAFMAWCSVKKDHRDNFTFYISRKSKTVEIYVKVCGLTTWLFTVIFNIHKNALYVIKWS